MNPFATYTLGAFGSSLTEPTGTGYAYLTSKYFGYLSFHNQAQSGNWPWANLVRLSAGVLSTNAKLFLTDYRVVGLGMWARSLEALTRRILTTRPTAKIVNVRFFGVANKDIDVIDPPDEAELASVALANHYNIPTLDYRAVITALVASGHHLNEYFADNIHPNALGHSIAFGMVRDFLRGNPAYFDNRDVVALPERMFDNGEYENTPIRRAATDYNARTGVGWAQGVYLLEDSTAGDTITFTATCQSFGLQTDAFNTTADISIDGGAYILNAQVNWNGYDLGSRGLHTIVIRVRAGVPLKFNEFWAI